MKTFLFAILVNLLCITARGQGTVLFQNYPLAAGVNAPVYESDGVTPLSGTQFMAQLLAGSSASNLAPIASTGFFVGTQAGYFNGGLQSVPGVMRGFNAWIEVRVWNTASGASFTQAQTSALPNSWWQSSLFSVVAGGGNVNPTAAPPLTGLGTSPVFLNGLVPEPSIFALSLVGAFVALFRFRRPSFAPQPLPEPRRVDDRV